MSFLPMNCLYPRSKTIVDALTGEKRTIVFPCGHCVNCMASFQDSWIIRLIETAKKYKSFVYDTLTIRPEAISYSYDFTKPDERGMIPLTDRVATSERIASLLSSYASFISIGPHISRESFRMLQKNGFRVPVFGKDELQKWFKRGREQYFRDKGVRCDCVYFMVQEYGPSTSRPHFHILVFGLSFEDYMKYFGSVWRRDYGWTKPSFILYSPDSVKDYNCVVRYVAKYLVKDSYFDPPMVKDNLQPRAFRLISKGIGGDYLNRPCFDCFKVESLQRWKSFCLPSDRQVRSKLHSLKKPSSRRAYTRYVSDCRNNIDTAFFMRDAGRGYIDLSGISSSNLDRICFYHDSSGNIHKLPDYYRNKLFKNNRNEKSILQLEIQNLLESRNRLLTNQTLQREAFALGVIIPDSELSKPCEDWDLPSGVLAMVLQFHNDVEVRKNQASAERRKVRLANHFRRGKMNISSALQ